MGGASFFKYAVRGHDKIHRNLRLLAVGGCHDVMAFCKNE